MLNSKRVRAEVSFVCVVPSYCYFRCVLLLYSEFTEGEKIVFRVGVIKVNV